MEERSTNLASPTAALSILVITTTFITSRFLMDDSDQIDQLEAINSSAATTTTAQSDELRFSSSSAAALAKERTATPTSTSFADKQGITSYSENHSDAPREQREHQCCSNAHSTAARS